MGNIPEGKGTFIWIATAQRIGDIDIAVQTLLDMKIAWVAMKFQQGTLITDTGSRSEEDFNKGKPDDFVKAMRDAGISVHGWCAIYNYSENQTRNEVSTTRRVFDRFEPDSHILDIEGGWDKGGGAYFAKKYCSEIKRDYPEMALGLCSYRWPSQHPGVPWETFLQYMDYNCPQVYWQDAHNPAYQLNRSFEELSKLTLRVKGKDIPFVPAGSAYPYGKWEPTVNDLNEFVNEVKRLKLTAWLWWVHELIIKNPEWKQAITDHPQFMTDSPEPPEINGYDDLPIIAEADWQDKLNRWAFTRGFRVGRPS